MSQAKIKTLTDDSGAIIYPRTKIEAVFGLENIDASIEAANNHVSNKLNPHQISYPQLGINGIGTGGTNATNRKDAFTNLSYLGINPIASQDQDATANWCSLGSGWCWYNVNGCLLDQPGTWGFLVNYVQGTDVYQTFTVQANGPVYYRCGNGGGEPQGWSNNGKWTRFYDSNNIIISTEAPSGGSNGDIWIQYE